MEIQWDKDLIFCQERVQTKEEAIHKLAKAMRNKGFVKEDYEQAVLKRENKYPTGLKLNKYNIAIPHTNPEYVYQLSVGIMTLKNEVYFHQMDDPEKEIGVKIIFLLALQGHQHIKMLSKMITLCSKASFVDELVHAKSNEALLSAMKKNIEGE